jgi:hypothetical protein
MTKRVFLPTIAAFLAVSLAAPPAMAAQTPEEIDQTVATYDQLVEIVEAEVVQAYSGLSGTVADLVAGTVRATIGNADAIKALAVPLIKSALKGVIAQYLQNERIDALVDSAVDAVADSEVITTVLTHEFTQAVIARTVEYAVKDIIDSLGLEADQEGVAESLTNQVWTAPLVSVGTAPTKVKSNLGSPIYVLGVGLNTSYYSYNVTAWNRSGFLNSNPKEIQVTGWNAGNIRVLASGTAILSAASKIDSVTETLANLDYVSILMDAGYRALRDEITERIEAALLQVKTIVLGSLQEGLAGIGVAVVLDPAASWTTIATVIAQGMASVAQDELNNALSRLPDVLTPGLPGENFFASLRTIAQNGANYLLSWLRNLDWRALFRGDTGPKGPSFTVKADRKAMTNTDTPVLTIEARDDNGVVLPGAPVGAIVTYSYGNSCQFPAGEAPSRRTCTITAEYNGMTARATIEVFDPSALGAPIQGVANPGETLRAAAPEGWPTVTRRWTRNGTLFSTATSYRLPTTEKLGNAIVLTQSRKYQGLDITGTAPALTVAAGAPASIKVTAAERAITNAGGVTMTAVVRDAHNVVIPAPAADIVYTYSLGEGCSFPTGEAPSRRECTITGTYGGVSASTTLEVFDPTALAGPIGGEAIPGATLRADAPEGWPTITRRWTRNGTLFSTAATYRLPSTEKAGNVIVLQRTMTYRGLTISDTAPQVVVGLGAPAALKLTPVTKAITNAGGAEVKAEAKDSFGNVIPAGATDTVYTYSLGEGCSFPAGEAPSRRVCTITGTYGGVSASTTVEVFDPTALAAPIDGVAMPGNTLKAVAPEGWPTITRRWTRNGTLFSTAASYRLPSTEKVGNVIELTLTMKYQGLTISGTAPVLVVTK